jgi:Predicted glycosyltransferases
VSPPSDNTPVVSVVIPAFNRCDSLLLLLRDVYRQVGVSFEVIVVDDHSSEDPTPRILTEFPDTHVLRHRVNSGPAAARNRGIRAARGRIVVGFDSDVTVPDPTVLARTVATFSHHGAVDGLAFRLLQPDGQSEDIPRWWHSRPVSWAGRRFATSYFSGTAYAFRRDALLRSGLFPEFFFMHYEEVELAFRLLDRGGTILYCPELAVLHHAHPVSRRSEIKVFYKPRNQVLLAVSCLPWPRALLYLIPRLGYQLLTAARHGHLPAFMKALRSAAQLLPDRLAERRVLQRSTLRRIAALRAGAVA